MLRYIIVFLLGFSCGSIGAIATWDHIKDALGKAEPVVDQAVETIDDKVR